MNVWNSLVDLGKMFMKVFLYYWSLIMIIILTGYVVSCYCLVTEPLENVQKDFGMYGVRNEEDK